MMVGRKGESVVKASDKNEIELALYRSGFKRGIDLTPSDSGDFAALYPLVREQYYPGHRVIVGSALQPFTEFGLLGQNFTGHVYRDYETAEANITRDRMASILQRRHNADTTTVFIEGQRWRGYGDIGRHPGSLRQLELLRGCFIRVNHLAPLTTSNPGVPTDRAQGEHSDNKVGDRKTPFPPLPVLAALILGPAALGLAFGDTKFADNTYSLVALTLLGFPLTLYAGLGTTR